jgi:hypothetical protein
MSPKNNNIISYRCHKSMVSWVNFVAQVFPQGRSGFLRILLTRVALEQDPPVTGLARLFSHEQPVELPIGGTFPIHVRVDDATLLLIKEAAAERGQMIAERCALATYNWRRGFKVYQEAHKEDPGWLTEYSRLFTENAVKAVAVYARKRGLPPVLTFSDTIQQPGAGKIEKVPTVLSTNRQF